MRRLEIVSKSGIQGLYKPHMRVLKTGAVDTRYDMLLQGINCDATTTEAKGLTAPILQRVSRRGLSTAKVHLGVLNR
jgi:hypothetical protein